MSGFNPEEEAWGMVENCEPIPLLYCHKGHNVQIYPQSIIINPKNLCLSSNIRISEFCWIHAGQRTTIGNFVHLSTHVTINGGGTCFIEDFCGVASGVRLITGSERIDGSGLIGPMVPPEYRSVERSFIHLKKHAFLCSNVVVLPGVTIGEGAVCGAGMVVTKDIEPWTINIPGKPSKPRNSVLIKEYEKLCYERLK